ncbi:MAG: gliding motility-associated-like protein [Flavobacteriales bacterium]|jgi:gliding motility-associated-like protein
MKKTLLIVVLFLSLGCFAQGEANIWYFGSHAGLDFNSGSPVALTDGQLVTEEGCATISNSSGQLLFYTDGITVYNRNHQVMPNGTGLLGDSSSTQSAIIVPKPNSSTIYYIFTTPAVGNPLIGARFSEVDISLKGGLGNVTLNKNILLNTPSCEKITAVRNSNNDGYWVVNQIAGGSTYFAYSVTASGINTLPVISNIGSNSGPDGIGALKFSPDGTKLINCDNAFRVQLFDFNTTTGIISNPRLISETLGSYGVEFSPSGNIAYITFGFTHGFSSLIQFDLTATNISNNPTILYQRLDWSDPKKFANITGLQLASNGKIYCALPGRNFIGAINNPEKLGLACDFQLNSVLLAPGSSCALGLPPFIQSFFNVGIKIQNNCVGEISSFSLSGNQNTTSANWDFGDGNTSTDISPSHIYATAGTYTVSITALSGSATSTKTRDIIISKIPTATQSQNLMVCDSNNDGIYNFDLTTQKPAILNGQDPDLYTVTYYANIADYNNNNSISTPNNYVNAAAYRQETIIAEVKNKENGSCKSSTTFDIDVFDSPKPNVTPPILTSCDNTSVGTDKDDRVVFDLTLQAMALLNGQSATQFSLSYFKDASLTQNIANPTTYQNTNPIETIYVKMVNNDNVNCAVPTSFKIEVLALPIITKIVDLKQCDDDIDGFSAFNLEQVIDKITDNAVTETISFFETAIDAQNNANPILNTTTYTNEVVSNDKVYVRVANSNECFSIAHLNLIVSTTQIPLNFIKTFTQCDDALLGTNVDGIASFDFSSVTTELQNVFPAGQLLDITYYRNMADALAEKNTITDITNHRNTGYPNTQNIYVRVDSRLNNDCLGLGSYISLTVESIPIIKPITQKHCDDDQDGLYAFDTSLIQTNLLNGLTKVTVSYIDQNNVQLSSPLPNPFVTASQTLKVIVQNNTAKACSYDSTVTFVVDNLPQAFPVSTTLTTICDDEVDPRTQDGKYAFDTSSFQNTILGGQSNRVVKYFDANKNSLPSPLPNPFDTGTQNIRVEVINPLNTTCTASLTIPFIVNPVPNIVLMGDELVCSNLPTFTKDIDAGLFDLSTIPNYSYLWRFNSVPIVGETNYTLTVNKAGLYTVEVTNMEGCSRTRTITVMASDIAKISNVDIVDLTDSNSITISVTGQGDYVYGLDEEYGIYQTENYFTNVSAGMHTIFVKDLNGCGVTPKEVAVLGIPNYFTPNGDGFNDYWNIKGVNASFNAKTIIYIFDRYGKLITQIKPTSQGWNGTLNGQQMPATDYWYSVQLEDGRILKGHFSLKR